MERSNSDKIAAVLVRTVLGFVLLAGGILVLTLQAHAAPTLDQSNTTYDTTFVFGTATNGGNTRTVCQSFTPAQATIVQVDFTLRTILAWTSSRDIAFYLTSGSCVGDGGTTLSTHTLTESEYNAFNGASPILANWTLDTPVSVSPGTTYYIAMRDLDACNLCFSTYDNSTSAYSGGIERRGTWADSFADQTRDIYFSTYYDGLYVSVSATNTPTVSGGLRWSGYGTLPQDLEEDEYTTNFYTRIFSTALGVDQTFTINSTSSTEPGYYETPASAIGISWPPGSYTVVTTQTTNQRTGSATTTVNVQTYPGASGVPVGGGGGSWGDEGLPPELSGGVPLDGGLGACLSDTFTTDVLDFLTNPAEVFVRIYEGLLCFLNSGLNVIKGIAPFKWAYQINGYWNTAVNSATATVDVALTVPDLGAGSRTITVIDSASSGAGIRGQIGQHSSIVSQVHTLLEYTLYLLFGFYLFARFIYHRFV